MALAPSEQLTYAELVEMARRWEGATLETVTGKRFRVGVYMDCPFFRPESSGLGQTDGRPPIERFVARYNETHSLRPSDYADVTRSASYLIGLLIAESGRRKRRSATGGTPGTDRFARSSGPQADAEESSRKRRSATGGTPGTDRFARSSGPQAAAEERS